MTHSEPKLFGPLLRSKRLRTGKRLVDFARESGFDPGLYSRIETGKRPPPDLAELVLLADHLGVPKESDEFAELLSAADHDRNPVAHKLALGMRDGKPWNPFTRLSQNEVLCSSLSELVSKAMQKAIEVEANGISVRSPSGRVVTFKLQAEKPKVKRAKAKY